MVISSCELPLQVRSESELSLTISCSKTHDLVLRWLGRFQMLMRVSWYFAVNAYGPCAVDGPRDIKDMTCRDLKSKIRSGTIYIRAHITGEKKQASPKRIDQKGR
jgi:hypothetical protein